MSSKQIQERVGNAFLDHRVRTELAVVVLLSASFLIASGASDFDKTLNSEMRSNLYDPLSAASGTLLGFVLAALAVLVALPSTERIEKLQHHPQWELIPSTYFRAARALLAGLVLCVLGLPLDSGTEPWVAYEVAVVIVLTLSLVRVAAALVALDQILAVAQVDQRRVGADSSKPIGDPGP